MNPAKKISVYYYICVSVAVVLLFGLTWAFSSCSDRIEPITAIKPPKGPKVGVKFWLDLAPDKKGENIEGENLSRSSESPEPVTSFTSLGNGLFLETTLQLFF